MRIKNKKGTALVYALGVITFVSILLGGLVRLITSQAKFGYDMVNREKAFQVAEACSNEYRWYLAHNTDGRSIEQVGEFWEKVGPKPRGLNGDNNDEWEVKTSSEETFGKCKVTITNPPINANKPVETEIEGYSVENVNIKKKLKIRFRRSSWSDYVVLTNEYASFDSNWDISGKIMSNVGVQFDGLAHGRVYAGLSKYNDENGIEREGVWSNHAKLTVAPYCEFHTEKNNCVFLGGKRFPVPQKDFEGVAVDLNLMRGFARYPDNSTVDECNFSGTRKNCYFSATGKAGKHLIFKENDEFEIVTVKDVKSNSNDIKNEDGSSRQSFVIPDEGIIFIDDNVWVEGKVDGKRVTVVAGSGGDIYIGNGNLKYANKEDGSNAIGLIADGDILLTSEKKNCDGVCDDLEIDAAMVAKGGMVGKQNFNPNCCGGGCEAQKNRIDIFGSVVSNKFVEFTLSKDCPSQPTAKMGFKIKNITYDNNLYLNPPPYFPNDVYYTVDLWQEI